MLFPIINELDALASVCESYTKKMTKRKTPRISARGFVYFCEVQGNYIMPPCHPCRPYRQQRLSQLHRFSEVGNHALGGDHQASHRSRVLRAERVTLVGSRIPMSIMLPYLRLLRCNRSYRRRL